MTVLGTRPHSHNQNQYSVKKVVVAFSENGHLEEPTESLAESFLGGNLQEENNQSSHNPWVHLTSIGTSRHCP